MTYLSHFPYADSAWNGEGFNFNLDPAYWLVDISGFIHGIPCDRLGGPDAIKGMLFANYERNSATASPIWKFWDLVSIQDAEMVGWWEDDAPVHAVVPPLPSPTPSALLQNCTDSFTHIVGEHINADGYADGVIGFGQDCGPPGSNQKYPNLTVAQAKVDCCTLGEECVGFDWGNTVPPTSLNDGCFQKNKGSGQMLPGPYDQYLKYGKMPPQPGPGVCSQDDIKATSYVNFGKSTVVIIASWCDGGGAVDVTLDIDWIAIGLNAADAKVTAPAVANVQVAADHGNGDGKFNIANVVNGGVMLLITN